DCASPQGAGQAECGCGPNLRWCEAGDSGTRLAILQAMDEQLLRFTDDVVKNDRPYTDILLAKDMEVNGPISHYLRYQTQTGGGDSILSSPIQNYTVPEIDFTDDMNWVKVDRGQRHAGLLTMAGYLLKFQSDRGRANRFYNAFLCQHFESST